VSAGRRKAGFARLKHWAGWRRREPSDADPFANLRLRRDVGDEELSAALAIGLARLLASRGRGEVVHLGNEEIGRRDNRDRVFLKYRFGVAGSATASVQLFVKRVRQGGCASPRLEAFLNEQRSPFFRTPHFYGQWRLGDVRIGVWDYVAGPALGSAPADPRATATAIDAVAAINSLKIDAALVAAETPLVAPIADRANREIRALVVDAAERDALLKMLDALARNEDRLIARFDALGHRFLTHHDMKPENIIVGDGGPVTIVDWTSARLSVAGTGLRLLAGGGKRAEAARLYVDRMSGFGHRLKLADVVFAWSAHQAFRNLHFGLKRAEIGRVRSALTEFARMKPAR
jgi:hypothetical protein